MSEILLFSTKATLWNIPGHVTTPPIRNDAKCAPNAQLDTDNATFAIGFQYKTFGIR